ncbi:MAG: ATP-binding protein [Lachnospiraceae bacterium]|nr:ATP-binding protein [Lachnospiraceae bacterium]
MARIEVEDNGKGIPKEILQNVVQPYYTNKKDGRHFGLGLSLCQKIMLEHRGSIEVKSPASAEGKGTIVTLYLPAGSRKRRKRH